jgi:hypothetical protein
LKLYQGEKQMIKYSLLAVTLLLWVSAAYGVDPTIHADAQAIDSACTAESTTAKCGSDKVGTGLLKCIHAYKVANPTFKVSAGCKTAMQQLHADKKAGK